MEYWGRYPSHPKNSGKNKYNGQPCVYCTCNIWYIVQHTAIIQEKLCLKLYPSSLFLTPLLIIITPEQDMVLYIGRLGKKN